MGRLIADHPRRDLQRSTHVETLPEPYADAGSTPAASTGYGLAVACCGSSSYGRWPVSFSARLS